MEQSKVPTVRIEKPKEGQTTRHACPVEGRAQDIPDDRELWIVKEPYPGNYHPDDGPALHLGNLFQSTAYVGNAQEGADQGQRIPIHVVMCPKETGRKFKEYIQGAHATGAWIGIPTMFDGQILATVTVVRKD